MKVCKFGGSSVANSDQIRKIADIVKDDPDRRIVVVSAPGKRFKGDDKVTDLLIACADAALKGEDSGAPLDAIIGRFAEMRESFGLAQSLLDSARDDLAARIGSDKSHPGKFMDRMKAAGEDLSARFVAAAFNSLGIKAQYVNPADAGMLLSDEFGNARLLDESYPLLAKALAKVDGVAIFPGFFGVTKGGDIATFPRGGSDITGAILAAATRASIYENFTDVDSVYPVDPRIVPQESRGITRMTYREMRELSYAGFGVFHDEAVQPAIAAKIPINIRNTNRPKESGTMVVDSRKIYHGRLLGIASDTGFCTLYVSKYMMNREIGFGRKLLQILEDEGISFEHTPSGIDNMSVIVREANFPEEARARVVDRILSELHADEAHIESGLALVMVVGEGMRYTIGLSARVMSALASANVNIEMLNQGSSEISMMFGVRSIDRNRAVLALYEEFFKNSDGGVPFEVTANER